ncbi:MAG: AAA family ATPase [Candidatus Poribacteria bacterium]|nr:AAA family ATPase [Candidatus Poribacteria bacterium]MDE0504224.1 AAA family ATPase [Candidatus Poribacteria bacterium]
MRAHGNTETTETRISTLPDVRISAENFGPIVNGSIDLRPLTVFVGPSNTGKTYLATLIYAFHKTLPDFSLLPVMGKHLHRFVQDLGDTKTSTRDERSWEVLFQDIVGKLQTKGRRFMFTDLPSPVRERWKIVLNDNQLLGKELENELQRCFGLRSISELVRLSGSSDSAELSLNVSDECRPLWNVDIKVSTSGITTEGRIEGMVLFPDGGAVANRWGHGKFRELAKKTVGEFFDEFLYSAAWNDRRGESHYLPAARSGVMLSHRVISSSLMANATRAGMDPFPEIPTFSGMVADFLQQLILYEEERTPDNLMKNFADVLERNVLDGKIRVNRASAGGYPDFVYQPRKSKKTIRLARASSMVTELAPIVLFLRGVIARGDTLIIDEPEAHLHPEMQVEFTRFLASVVRSGIRIILTTHSEWVLEELANLVQASELSKSERLAINGSDIALTEKEVGAWLFKPKRRPKGSVVEEIPLNRESGTFAAGYDKVAVDGYNRWAEMTSRTAKDEDK